ncbi:MAG: hypothetical protein JWQ87_1108 [Candidatus Sulfotelmatobacter sp.]|nr:hypothetical protein [Candidatus Sulfotelmatobacter sp.]
MGKQGNLIVYLGLLGEAVGGHGVPLGETPAEFPCVLPDVEGDAAEFDEPEFEPEPDEPVFGAEEPEVPAVLGNVPHGEPLGLVPGVFEVFGFTVEGCVLLPGVAGFVELDPGTPEGELGVADPLGGVAVLAGGVAVLAGGLAGLAGGVAECGGGVAVPGACDCPAAEPPAGAAPPAPPAPLCATTQVAHKRRTDKKASFFADMGSPR